MQADSTIPVPQWTLFLNDPISITRIAASKKKKKKKKKMKKERKTFWKVLKTSKTQKGLWTS